MYFQALEPIERVIKNREWQLYGFRKGVLRNTPGLLGKREMIGIANFSLSKATGLSNSQG
jgi:hypothetical protein